MRAQAQEGHVYLEEAKTAHLHDGTAQASALSSLGLAERLGSGAASHVATNALPSHADGMAYDLDLLMMATKPPPAPPLTNSGSSRSSVSSQEQKNFSASEGSGGGSSTAEMSVGERAFMCFVRAVHALQSLNLQGDVLPKVFLESLETEFNVGESYATHVLEDEQADLYCCWAESVLLKFRSCTCPGCTALALQALRMAHIQATHLLMRLEHRRLVLPDRWRLVGLALGRVVHSHICLLLQTEAVVSPSRASLWRVQQCLLEWDRLGKAKLTGEVVEHNETELLSRWSRMAASNLSLAEALLGYPLTPPHPEKTELLSRWSRMAASNLSLADASLGYPITQAHLTPFMLNY
eukprot:gene23154-30359_t